MMETMKRAALSLLLASSPLLGGCYAHTPVAIGDLSPGDAVRVRVSAAEAERLEQEAQVTERVFRARVVESDASALLLRIPVPTSTRLGGELYNRISLTPEQLVEIELRELDGLRTAGVVAVAAVAVSAAAFVAFEAISAGEGAGKEPGEPSQGVIRIPFFGWAFR